MTSESTVYSRIFGAISIEPQHNYVWISGSCDHNGTKVELQFTCVSVEEYKAQFTTLLPFAEQMWLNREKHFKTFREHAASELLTSLNELLDCGQENPPDLTQCELLNLLAIPSSVTFVFTADDCEPYCIIAFGDDTIAPEHIEVSIAKDGKVIESDIKTLL